MKPVKRFFSAVMAAALTLSIFTIPSGVWVSESDEAGQGPFVDDPAQIDDIDESKKVLLFLL